MSKRKVLRRIGENARREWSQILTEKDLVASGFLQKSLQWSYGGSDVIPELTFTVASYAEDLDKGGVASREPTYQNIKKWGRYRGIRNKKYLNNIWNKLKETGAKPHPFLNAWETRVADSVVRDDEVMLDITIDILNREFKKIEKNGGNFHIR